MPLTYLLLTVVLFPAIFARAFPSTPTEIPTAFPAIPYSHSTELFLNPGILAHNFFNFVFQLFDIFLQVAFLFEFFFLFVDLSPHFFEFFL